MFFYFLQSSGMDKVTAEALKDSIHDFALQVIHDVQPEGVLMLVVEVFLAVDKYMDDPLIRIIHKYEDDEPWNIREYVYDRVIIVDHSRWEYEVDSTADPEETENDPWEFYPGESENEPWETENESWGVESLDDEIITGFVPATEFTIESLLKETTMFGQMNVTTEENNCVICLEDFTSEARVASLQLCIVQWLELSHLCPLCRFRFHFETQPSKE
ncbi:PREDICTED: uncharacterized protein LOC104812887 [Tarenaya hassleriana]|uniref:uncharacterized protein LOC104812887 n=1 Tax=Tarenaya hassleriana TaxID=28532 RepID=UPI00053C79AF|nr:PREDICTED: uncharacterized protein LOC104812887 [Tarenaya hassleriana]